MSTFNPATDLPPAVITDVTASSYAPYLESIAPGVTGFIKTNQSSGQTWMDSLSGLLPVLAGTDEQKLLLSQAASSAKQGLPPPPVPGQEDAAAAQTRKMFLYGGIAIAVLLIMKR